MITIQILVAAVAVAAILTSVIVHMVDKKHETREVARLNAEITERKATISKRDSQRRRKKIFI